jgi:hypothetical protein
VSRAQSFSSGSTGADGDLIINTPGVTVLTLTPQGGGNVFNFKSIQVSAGSTVSLSGLNYPNPLFFLAQTAVTINGTISLDGANGYAGSSQPGGRTSSVPGAGGYAGGVGAFGSSPAQLGGGPGGGAGGTQTGNHGQPNTGCGGTFTGNSFLVPVVGGSGGGGGQIAENGPGPGGGAGGGALVIASSTSITLNGTISANGGASGAVGTSGNGGAGGGSGGAIRLVAPIIAGSGATLSALGGGPLTGGSCSQQGGNGLIRMEAFQNTLVFQNAINPGSSAALVIFSSPFGVFLPSTPPPSLQVTGVGGVPVPSSPTGSFTIPDVIVNSSSPLVFNIQASNIPVTTPVTVTLILLSENGPDQILTSTPLSGTLASSTATASATLPSGYSRGYVKATWTQ